MFSICSANWVLCCTLLLFVTCALSALLPLLHRWYHYNPHEIAVLDSEISLDPSIAPPTCKNPLSLLHQLQASHAPSVPGSTTTSPLKRSPDTCLPTAQPSTTPSSEGDNPLPHDVGVALMLGSIEEEVEHLSHRTMSFRPFSLAGALQESQSSDHSESHHSSASERTSSASTVRLIASDEVTASANAGTLSAKEVQSLWSPSEILGMAQNRNVSQQSSIASLHSSATGSGVPSLQISCLPSPALDQSLRGGIAWPTGPQLPPANTGTYSPTASTLSAYVEDGASNAELDNSVGSAGRFPGIARESSADLLVRSLPASSFGVMQPVATSSAYNSPTRSFKGSLSPHAASRRESSGSGVLSNTWNRLKSVFRSSPERKAGPRLVVEDKDEDILHDYYNINVSVVGGQTVVNEDLPMSSVEEKPQDLHEEVLVWRSKSPLVERPSDEIREEWLEEKQEDTKQTTGIADGAHQEPTVREKEVSAR